MPLGASAILFGVLWTAGMLWWNSPLDAPELIILSIAGILAATGWYWLMRLWLALQAKS